MNDTALHAVLTTLGERIDALTAQVADLLADRNEKIDTIALQRASLDKAHAERNEAWAELARRSCEADKLQRERDALQAQLQAQPRPELAALYHDYNVAQDRAKELQARLDAVVANRDALDADLLRARKSIAELEAQLKEDHPTWADVEEMMRQDGITQISFVYGSDDGKPWGVVRGRDIDHWAATLAEAVRLAVLGGAK